MPRHNVFSVDVEDFFHVEAFADVVDRSSWDDFPSRVVENTHRLLDLLEAHKVEATFFILGWVCERQPALVREIASRGHELACHSYWHRPIFRLTPDEFREDTRRPAGVPAIDAAESSLASERPGSPHPNPVASLRGSQLRRRTDHHAIGQCVASYLSAT